MRVNGDQRLKQWPCVILFDCLAQKTECKYTKPVITNIPKISPGAILSNCRKNKTRSKYVTEAKKRKTSEGSEVSEMLLGDSWNGPLTPVPSTPSSCEENDLDSEPCNKRRKSDNELLEVEKIVGYFRGSSAEGMSYLVKWKNYDSQGNTWEPIENLVNCNKILMQYFEFKRPDLNVISKMDNEITESLYSKSMQYLTYSILRPDVTREDIVRFPRYGAFDIRKIFSRNFERYRKTLEKEYNYIVRCLIGMCYHRDPGMFLRGQHYKIALKLCEMREKQLKTLNSQEKSINALEKCAVKVVNECDLGILPELEYITESRPGKDVIIPMEPVVSCDCPDGCGPDSKCCGVLNESKFVYTADRRLNKCRDCPIYECNVRCKCSEDCPNRVVQRGRSKMFAIFKTEKCGWGVKTLEKIGKGEFVCEYVGELISDKESNVREVEYCKKNLSYMFNLDFTPNGEEAPFVIDATHCGNLSRYLNHSCEPNVEVRVVWIDCLDPDKPRLAFFAKREIRKGEELSFQYTNSDMRDIRVISKIRCYCNKPNCREWIWGV